jgi:hypothetical protein
MDMQAAPPTYAEMNTGRPPVGNPPVLGQQVPGMSGGLPSQGGLSVLANPMAEQLQSFGRGDDSMLVHMTPNEVNSLQGLAMATWRLPHHQPPHRPPRSWLARQTPPDDPWCSLSGYWRRCSTCCWYCRRRSVRTHR